MTAPAPNYSRSESHETSWNERRAKRHVQTHHRRQDVVARVERKTARGCKQRVTAPRRPDDRPADVLRRQPEPLLLEVIERERTRQFAAPKTSAGFARLASFFTRHLHSKTTAPGEQD